MPTLCAGETDRGNRAAAVHQGPDSRKRVTFGHAGAQHITLSASGAVILRYKIGTTEREKKRYAAP